MATNENEAKPAISFADASNNAEVSSWAKNVGSADPDPGESSQSSSDAAEKHIPSDADAEQATGLDAIKSVTHRARRRLHLDSIRATGPSRFFNPTNIRVHVRWNDEDSTTGTVPAGSISHERAFLWRSRDQRKGRNSIAVPTSAATSPSRPWRQRFGFGFGQLLKGVWRMCTHFPYWDMAWWSGWTYTIGSALFVMDGAWAWRAVAYPDLDPASLSTYGGPLSFFFGAVLYQIGAVMSYFEAINDGSFSGSAMRRFLEGHEEDSKAMLDGKIHNFFGHFVPPTREERAAQKKADAVDPEAGWRTRDRAERPGSVYPAGKGPAPRRGGVDLGEAEEKEKGLYYDKWRWYPSWYCLRHHHVYEIGYIACSIQLLGVTLYGVTAIVVLPGVLSSLSHWQEEAAFWGPQVAASCCFLIASLMFMFETQTKWWKPEIFVLGWWLGFFATVGSIGFL